VKNKRLEALTKELDKHNIKYTLKKRKVNIDKIQGIIPDYMENLAKAYMDLNNRIDKAIKFIETHNIIGTNKEYLPSGIEKCYSLELMDILKGSDKE